MKIRVRFAFAAVPFCAAIGLLGCGSSEPSTFFADQRSPRTAAARRIDKVRLETVAEYGTDHGDLWFSIIGDVAADPDGHLLAVAESDRCQITIIDRESRAFRRFGKCGDGPGEFVELGKLAFMGDELLAFDNRRKVLVRFTLDGTEVARVTPEVMDAFTRFFSSFDPFGPHRLLVGLSAAPVVRGPTDHRLVALVDVESGKTLEKLIDDTPMAKAALRPFRRSIETCVGGAGGSKRAVAANIWSTQLLVMDEQLNVRANVATLLQWRHPASRENEARSWRPPTYFPGLACGADYFMVLYQNREASTEAEAIISHGYLEIRDYEGRIVFSREAAPPERGSIFHFLPAAASGDRFFAFTSTFADYPTVREYRVYEDA